MRGPRTPIVFGLVATPMTMLMLMMTSHHDGCHDECLLAKRIKPLRLAFFELIGPPMTLEARCIQAPWLFNNIAVPLAGCASARTHRHAQALGVATGAGGGAANYASMHAIMQLRSLPHAVGARF